MNLFCRKATENLAMKLIASLLFAIFLGMNVADCQSITTSRQMDDVHQWVEQHFAKGKVPPFSFVYGGKSSDNFIKNWRYSIEKIKSTDSNVDESVYSYSD